MAKFKKPEKINGVAKSKKLSAGKPKSADLSEERVVDSESEGEQTKGVKASFAHSETKAKGKTKAMKRTTAQQPPKSETSSASNDSDESEEDSDSESSAEDEDMVDAPALKKPDTVPAQVNGVKRKVESVSSLDSSSSSEDESSEEEEKPNAKRVKIALKDAGETDQVGKAASEETEDSSDSEDDAPEPSPDTARAPATARHAGQFESIPVQPFKPPSGFIPVTVSAATFSAKSFAGRQVWHIVAPSNVSLKSLEDMTLENIRSGAPLLSYKGAVYAFSEDTSQIAQFDHVILPSSTSYDGISQTIQKTLHVKQKVVLPALSEKQADTDTGSSAAASVARPSIAYTRPQPKGMRMRYKPAGFGAGDAGLGSDSDEDEESHSKGKASKLQFPKALGVHGTAIEADNAQAATPKKSKKKRKESDVDMTNDPASSLTNGKLQSDLAIHPNAADSPAPKNELSKEEKRRRKAEKKAKKEAKAAGAVVTA